MFGARKGKKTKVFAVPLAESVLANRPNGSTIVADVVTDVLAYLEKHEFYKFEGIYRVPGRQSRLEALRESYDKGKPIDFEAKMEDPFTCADLLLLYLRSLPEQLMPQPIAGLFDAAVDSTVDVDKLRALVWQLPVYNRALLKLVCQHAARVVSAESVNKMGIKNTTIVFVPSLYCSPKVFASLVTASETVFRAPCTRCGVGTIDAGDASTLCLSCAASHAAGHGTGAAGGGGGDAGGGVDSPDERASKSRSSTMDKVARSPLMRLSRNSKSPNATPLSTSGGGFGGGGVGGVGGNGPVGSSAGSVSLGGVAGAAATGTLTVSVPSSGPTGTATPLSAPRKPLPQQPPNTPATPIRTSPPLSSPRNEKQLSPRPSAAPMERGSEMGSVAKAGVTGTRVFGVDLVSLCRMQPETGAVLLPSVVRQCWKLVEKHVAHTPGLYCTAVSAQAQQEVERLALLFDSGVRVALEQELEGNDVGPHIAAALFRRYLLSLPVSVFTPALLPQFESCVRTMAAEARPLALSGLVFRLPLELRTFLLHFISHLRTVVKHEPAAADRLLAEFAVCCKCSRDLITSIYNNRRTILQPNCSGCQKLISLADSPAAFSGEILCSDCAGQPKK